MNSYTMQFENPYGFTRGMICVIRIVDGKPVALKLQNEISYKEWSNAFSII